MQVVTGDTGVFSSLLNRPSEAAATAQIQWVCGCPACAAAAGSAQGGSLPGGYATTPGDNAYQYVVNAAAPQQGGGNLAALMAGSKWSALDTASARTIVTYSFADPQTSSFSYDTNNFQSTLTAFSASDRQLTRDLLGKIAAVCNLQFVEVADNAAECGVLRYGYSQEPNAMGFAGYAYFPSSTSIGGDIWIGAQQASSQWDFYRGDLFLHETLHALGLKHPFDAGVVLSTDQNIIPNTVMSYSTLPGGASGYMTAYPTEPMALDISALQYLYGASNQNSGNTVYDLASAQMQTGFHALWDAGGIDTLDASRAARAVTLDLHEGARSDIGARVTANATVNGSSASTTYSSTLTIATGATIENAVGGAYDDVIVGNDGTNSLWGGAGNDRIEGRAGNDVINGGAGSDTIDGGAGTDVASYDSSRANFIVTKTGSGYTVTGENATDTLTGIERLVFSDGMVALDVDGNAGTIAKLLAAVFGASAVNNEQYVAIGLSLLDSGMSASDIAQLAINARLGGPSSNAAVVDLLYANVMGSAPTASEHALYSGLLDSGQLTQGALGQLAANCAMNQSHVDLVGMASTGLDYAL